MPNLGRLEVEERAASGLIAVDGKTFPLKATRIQARAQGGVAATTLVQEYANPHPDPLEVIYTMPLPADGAVVGYAIRLGERVVTGHVERREEARAQYRKALEEGRIAGLLEQERADTFTQTLGSLPPGASVRVEIEVLHPLAFHLENTGDVPRWEYRFPTVVGVRYQAEPGRVEDAAALDAERADAAGSPVRLEVHLRVADGALEVTDPRSPSHSLDLHSSENETQIALAASSRLDRDLVVLWRATSLRMTAHLVEGRGLPGDDGRYALLTLTPPSAPQAVFPRDITLLIDASGSMSGKPLQQAKQIAETLLGSLAREDRLEILAFSNQVVEITQGLVPATEKAMGKAVRRLRELEAGGGTEMTKALLHALEPLRRDSRRQVVLLTDGYIGFEHEVVGQVMANLPEGARLHVVGIGSAPNRTLTRGASRAGGGLERLVGNDEDPRDAAEDLRRVMAAPLLTDLAVRGSALIGVAPERPGDLLAGHPVLLALELKPEGGTIEVEGRLAGRSEPWIQRIEVAGRVDAPLPLGAFYGRERVEDCEMRLAAARGGRDAETILDEIETIALRHRIASRRTSLVAISEDPTVDPRDPRRRETLTVELPADVSAEGVGLMGAPFHLRRQMEGVFHLGLQESTVVDQMAMPAEFLRREIGDSVSVVTPIRLDGRVVREEGDLLIMEFETPPAGMTIPDEGVEVTIEGKSGRAKGRIVKDQSTRPGFHSSGLTVRLAIRLLSGGALPVALERIRWVEGRSRPVVIRLRA